MKKIEGIDLEELVKECKIAIIVEKKENAEKHKEWLKKSTRVEEEITEIEGGDLGELVECCILDLEVEKEIEQERILNEPLSPWMRPY